MIMAQEQAFLKAQTQLQGIFEFVRQATADGKRSPVVSLSCVRPTKWWMTCSVANVPRIGRSPNTSMCGRK